jgi:small conductance mechanosensitive channel
MAFAPALHAQDAQGANPSGELLSGSAEIASAAQSLRADWLNKPRLIPLVVHGGGSDSLEGLQGHLARLGLKTFSNRAWKSYWQRQETAAAALAEALSARSGSDASLIAGLRRWAQLAGSKVTNQDVYFHAIEAARDAAEERLEAAIELQSVETVAALSSPDLPTPYERRKLRLADLAQRIETQKAKRQLAAAENRFIARQLESETSLNEALRKDVELALQEVEISRSMRQGAGPQAWLQFWAEVEESSTSKHAKLDAEAMAGGDRQRTREVEFALGTSQLDFRRARIASLQAEHDVAASFAGWLDATRGTALTWLRQESWRLGLGLLILWVGIKLALRLIGKVSDIILERAEGNPDDPTDVDQRSKTLASVFSGIARIAVYVVGALLALEQIGVNTGPLLGSVAILGLAISFGSQNLVRDVVNGFFILLENQYAVGELVVIGGMTGTVEKITIRSTWIRAWTGELHVFPNGTISSLTNKSRDWAVAPCHIGVGYGADLDVVKQVVNSVGEQVYASEDWHEILEEPPAYVGVTELADSCVIVRVVARIRPGHVGGITRELNYRLKVAFDEAGIDIPYPQRVIHHATLDPASS